MVAKTPIAGRVAAFLGAASLIAGLAWHAPAVVRPAFAQPARAQSAPVPRGFFEAIVRDDDAEVRVYLLRGASVAMRDAAGTPALVLAVAERAFQVARTFLAIPGTEVDVVNKANETALMFAALHGSSETAALLIEKGAEVNRTGWTPLHYAATGGHQALVDLLLERHAYIDAESPNRTTPLMLAARQQHEPVVRALVAAGADPTLRNATGLAAADYAQRAQSQALADWLRAKSVEFDAKYRAGSTVRR
jgi:ankyrin repeat protein